MTALTSDGKALAAISSLSLQCSIAMRTLMQAKKQRVRDYDTRIREIKSVQEKLCVQAQGGGEAELFDTTQFLSIEAKRIIESPLAGIDD